MTRGELLTRWLDGTPLATLQAECEGSAEAALRVEFRALVTAMDATQTDAAACFAALDKAAGAALERPEHDAYWRGYDLGKAQAHYAASLMVGHGMHVATVRGGR